MQAVTSGTFARGELELALAIATWLAALVPQWVLMLRGVSRIDRLRERVARKAMTRLIVQASWMAALLLAFAGTVFVCRDLLGPQRLAAQRIIWNATLAQEAILIVVGIVLLARRGRDGHARASPQNSPSPGSHGPDQEQR